MRTIEMGAWMPPMGRTPDSRRPLRMMTLPPIASRSRALGLPTSSAPSGVMVAAFRPKPWRTTASAASNTAWFRVRRRFSSDRSWRSISSGKPGHVRVEDAQGLLQELLAGLVALHDDEGARLGQVGDGTASSIA